MSSPIATDSGASADASAQTFNINTLSTKSVTLYPARAHIVRQIDNVALRPGHNPVEIIGLSPSVDEHSIQIEGQGAATIADMTVELIPNPQLFEELYLDDSDESDDSSDEDVDDSDDEDSTRDISAEIKALDLSLTAEVEVQNSATERLSTLDRYSKSASPEHLKPDELTKLNKTYEEERNSIFKVHSEATQKIARLKKQIKRKEHEKDMAGKEAKKQKQRAAKEKAKEKRRKSLQKAEKRQKARYEREEKLRYWPKKIYKITLLLEAASLDTPGSSRRGSVDSITLASSPRADLKGPPPGPLSPSPSETSISLVLSYVTRECGWSPRYDISISSVQKTATIIYRTEFLNRTSETWKDTKLAFSTSQTSYQGLEDAVPFMHAWRVTLSKYNIQADHGLLSLEEAAKSRTGRPDADTFNRSELFALDDNYIPAGQSSGPLLKRGGQQSAPKGFSSSNSHHNPNSLTSTSGGLFGASTRANAHMVASAKSASRSAPGALSRATLSLSHKPKHGTPDSSRPHQPALYAASDSDSDSPDPVDFEEASWEDSGLTATYDVPGTRTLSPSSTTRRHKIAALHASRIHLSHVCVPKLRSAAFLRAKVRNPSSSVTLLKGSAGVTLDGSFLGNVELPRVAPGQTFDLSLGVDPGIHVNYPKPSVHRSTQGMIFAKESAHVFSRSIWLNNTKKTVVDLLVLDQVPVSEDERLRVGIVTPRGLVKEGDAVKAGVSAKEGSSGAVGVTKGEAWGSAVAKLKKGGELAWTVTLEGGKGCLLKLEYEARLPPGEGIVPA